MKLPPALHRAVFLVGAVAALLVIVWTEQGLWRQSDRLHAQSGAVASERFHRSDHLEARLRSLNDLAFRYSLQPDPATQTRFAGESADLQQWLAAQLGDQTTVSERDHLRTAQERFKEYLAHTARLLEGHEAGVSLPAWRQQKEKLVADLLRLATELGSLEREALNQHLASLQQSSKALHRRLVMSSLVLLAMGAVLVVLVYQGAVAPLRQRLRQTQAVLERQEKLSSLGVLAAGIAHEIRNPLTSIKARLFTQQALLGKDSEAREDNQFITEEITRLEHIVRDFLAFARPTEPRLAALRATQPLRELAPLLEPELRQSHIELKEEFLADPFIHADPAQLKQVLINLVKNAADAIGADGTITLRSRSETQGTGRRASVRVLLEVEDTGPGIAPDVQKRLFDPFFTTKASGTGLGLSLAARMVEKNGGRIEYATAPGRGSTFRIVLPVKPESPS